MKYSYIKPRKKSILTPEIRLVLAFFSMTIFMLLSTYGFLMYKDKMFIKDKLAIENEKIRLQQNTKDIESKILHIEKQMNTSTKVFTKNSVLRDSLKNLFDLVPQRITLTEAKLLHNGLTLYGITPNKDVYNFMLQAPLRSIFHQTYTSFYPAKDGWLRFVSTNYMDDETDKILEDTDSISPKEEKKDE